MKVSFPITSAKRLSRPPSWYLNRVDEVHLPIAATAHPNVDLSGAKSTVTSLFDAYIT